MIKSYIIKVDGKYYCGEGDEYVTQIPVQRNGWHSYNKGKSGIKFSRKKEDAAVCCGTINLKSHLDRIFNRMQPDKIILTCVDKHEPGVRS